jgi:hypothetical protein
MTTNAPKPKATPRKTMSALFCQPVGGRAAFAMNARERSGPEFVDGGVVTIGSGLTVRLGTVDQLMVSTAASTLLVTFSGKGIYSSAGEIFWPSV